MIPPDKQTLIDDVACRLGVGVYTYLWANPDWIGLAHLQDSQFDKCIITVGKDNKTTHLYMNKTSDYSHCKIIYDKTTIYWDILPGSIIPGVTYWDGQKDKWIGLNPGQKSLIQPV